MSGIPIPCLRHCQECVVFFPLQSTAVFIRNGEWLGRKGVGTFASVFPPPSSFSGIEG